ncbi:M20 family peptidase [Roseomonas nepalensis]|uniref:Probable succinyl-diaminopimelate desuccinylase n=1 Tax=Muricoccus nepalensis TaxID=1854500 RepID=A0A502FW10_9PROT|nr:M20 family metallopeptidase [Roseomonas nepalensis]TPG53675.1 M20 family peptidase [Roseomonas nepalensis]
MPENIISHDAVALAQRLVRFSSLNPPGDEKPCIEFLAQLLAGMGFSVETHEFAPGRPSVIARLHGLPGLKPLAFTGHLDVVPVGAAKWTFPPFDGVIVDGLLHGRGACDMKSGVAAFVSAAARLLKTGVSLRRGLVFVLTAGEETGCQGAFDLARRNVLGEAELLVVAEPTSNQPVVAHKGSLRVGVTARGRTAHSSMPLEGESAISKIVAWISRLESHRFEKEHPLLGSMTAVTTTISGGQNINSVPDIARFTADFRTLPDDDHGSILVWLQELFGPEAQLEVITDFSGFATDPDHPAIVPLLAILADGSGAPPTPLGAPYFTDASALVHGFGHVAAVVIGPGHPAQCHKTDEHCPMSEIERANGIYEALMRHLCT